VNGVSFNKHYFLTRLKDPANPEHDEMKEWLGIGEDDEWNVNNFNLEETIAMVRLV